MGEPRVMRFTKFWNVWCPASILIVFVCIGCVIEARGIPNNSVGFYGNVAISRQAGQPEIEDDTVGGTGFRVTGLTGPSAASPQSASRQGFSAGDGGLKVVSKPEMRVKLGSRWRYAIEVMTDSPPVNFELQGGPSGMTLSPEGVLEWHAVAVVGSRKIVTVKIQDSSGRGLIHAFHLLIYSASRSSQTALPSAPPTTGVSGGESGIARRTSDFDGSGYRGNLLQVLDGPTALYFVLDLPIKEERIPRHAVIVRHEDRVIPGTLRVISVSEMRAMRTKRPLEGGSPPPNLPPYDFVVAWEPVNPADFVVVKDNTLQYKVAVDFENGLNPEEYR